MDSSQLVTALAERRDDRGPDRQPQHDHARARQPAALAESIGLLPPFMRRGQHHLREPALDPGRGRSLVDASKPVAKRLQPFLSQARAFAADAEPTVRDLERDDPAQRSGQ